jgi:demethylmenaquinone methyltransferase/2-methoxy-6-polyprenyl-1,4-benzoquinol methylase
MAQLSAWTTKTTNTIVLMTAPQPKKKWENAVTSGAGCEHQAMDEDGLLAEQRAYYRARAPEYDEWWQRRGRYDTGEDDRLDWQRQVAVVEAALERFGAAGEVLELAGGTGWWTERLACTAGRLTVVDASPETLTHNRARVGRSEVEYVVADLFEWQPDRRYDVVFFSFWLSHVPRPRFAEFWALVRRALAPGGRAFLIDNRHDPSRTEGDPYVAEYSPDLHLRRLGDGSEYRVVKVMYEPAELQAAIEAEAWRATIDATRWFLYGSASPI